jgi:hypothetical protein
VRRIITIRLEVPDGVEVRVNGGSPSDFDDEPLPDPPWINVGSPAEAMHTIATVPRGDSTGVCPVHQTPWRLVPAGTSKRTGKQFSSFRACGQVDCQERPR